MYWKVSVGFLYSLVVKVPSCMAMVMSMNGRCSLLLRVVILMVWSKVLAISRNYSG